MELKHSNPNTKIILASILNILELLFLIVKVEFKKESKLFFSKEVAIIACKISLLDKFTLLIQME